MRSFWRRAALTAILTLSVAGTALCETLSFEGFSQVALSSEQDHDIGEFLAMIESQNQALIQAVSNLSTRSFFSGTRLQQDYFPALALVLSNDVLAFAPTASSRSTAQYKIKLRYDSTRFPDKIDSYFQENFYGVALVKRALERNRTTVTEIRSYLQKISQIQDPGYLQLVRQSEGNKLLQQFRLYQQSLEASTFYGRKQFDKALESIDAAIKVHANEADLYMFRGLVYAEKKKYDDALRDLSKAIELAPQEATFHLLRGSVYMTQGILIDKSRQDFNRALELQPDIGLAYLLRAYTQQAKMDCPAARADFKRACDLGMSNACDKTCTSF